MAMTEQELRQRNLYYYSLISEYIDAIDKWIAARQGTPEKNARKLDCQRIEKVMRRERDKFKGKVERMDIFNDIDCPNLF